MGRTLTFKWTIIQKPASASEIILTQSTLPTTTVYRLVEGNYKIQLEVKNEFGISGYDTVEIKVLPDPLKGTTRVFEDIVWKRVDDGWGEYIAIIIPEPDFFENRFEGNMEVRVWDEEKKEWFDPKKFKWDTNEEFGLRIYYSCLCDQDVYFKMAGVKTRIQVKFL
jgi:hypothetical protein